MARASVLAIFGVLALALAAALYLVGGRSAMLIVCAESPFVCAVENATRDALGPIGVVALVGVGLLVWC